MRLRSVILLLVALLCLPLVSASARSPHKWLYHRVKKGDTLIKIAKRYRTTPDKVRRLNSLTRRSAILPGQKLRVRARADKRSVRSERRAKRPTRRGHRHARRARSEGGWIVHKVRRGDYLWRLADRYDVTIKEIVRNNDLGPRRRIHPGQTLRIKRGGDDRLVGGITIPRKGPGYIATRPANSWGTPGTVRLIQDVYARVAEQHPGTAPGIVADLSKEGGGFLPPHRSHQRGVDVDVSYFKVGNVKTRGLEVMTEETLDVEKSWTLIREFINTGHVSLILMDYRLQEPLHAYLVEQGYGDDVIDKVLQYPRGEGERRGIVRHHPGHHHHLHVRFTCVKADDPCARPAVAIVPPPPAREDRQIAGARPVDAGRATRRQVDVTATHPPARDAFAQIAGLTDDDARIDAHSRLEAIRHELQLPQGGGPANHGAPSTIPRPAELPERMTRFGCTR